MVLPHASAASLGGAGYLRHGAPHLGSSSGWGAERTQDAQTSRNGVRSKLRPRTPHIGAKRPHSPPNTAPHARQNCGKLGRKPPRLGRTRPESGLRLDPAQAPLECCSGATFAPQCRRSGAARALAGAARALLGRYSPAARACSCVLVRAAHAPLGRRLRDARAAARRPLGCPSRAAKLRRVVLPPLQQRLSSDLCVCAAGHPARLCVCVRRGSFRGLATGYLGQVGEPLAGPKFGQAESRPESAQNWRGAWLEGRRWRSRAGRPEAFNTGLLARLQHR